MRMNCRSVIGVNRSRSEIIGSTKMDKGNGHYINIFTNFVRPQYNIVDITSHLYTLCLLILDLSHFHSTSIDSIRFDSINGHSEDDSKPSMQRATSESMIHISAPHRFDPFLLPVWIGSFSLVYAYWIEFLHWAGLDWIGLAWLSVAWFKSVFALVGRGATAHTRKEKKSKGRKTRRTKEAQERGRHQARRRELE